MKEVSFRLETQDSQLNVFTLQTKSAGRRFVCRPLSGVGRATRPCARPTNRQTLDLTACGCLVVETMTVSPALRTAADLFCHFDRTFCLEVIKIRPLQCEDLLRVLCLNLQDKQACGHIE